MASILENEIREQPTTLARLLTEGRKRTEEVAERIRAFHPRFVVTVARGSSDNAARFAQYLFGIRHGLTAASAAPSIRTRYGASPSVEGALVIGVSQSGRSPDLLAVMEDARRQGAFTLAVTNDPASPMAAMAAESLPLYAGEERSVAATKTYSAQLLALAMLSAALDQKENAWQELASVPDWVRTAIERNGPLVPITAGFRQAHRLAVVGRGWNMSTAFEVALKIKEISYVMTEPYSFADFLHGPVAMVDRSLPLLAVVPGGKTDDDADALISLSRSHGAPLVVISDRQALLAVADVALPLPTGLAEWLSPIVAVVPGQLFALTLTLDRGLEPDAPRGLSKVTRTL